MNEIFDKIKEHSINCNSEEEFKEISQALTKSLKNTNGIGVKTFAKFMNHFEKQIKEIKYKQEINEGNIVINKAFNKKLQNENFEENLFMNFLSGINGSNLIIKVKSTEKLNLIINFMIKLCDINNLDLRFELNCPYSNDFVQIGGKGNKEDLGLKIAKNNEKFLWFELYEDKIYCFYELTDQKFLDKSEIEKKNTILDELFIKALKEHTGIEDFSHAEEPRIYIKSFES